MKNCLVTGASGFVGRELCRRLREKKGAKIIAVSRNQAEGDWDELIRWDLADGTLPAAEKFAGIDTVFHLAGVTHDSRSGSGVESTYRKVNTDATLDMARIVDLVSDSSLSRLQHLTGRVSAMLLGLIRRERDRAAP